VQVRRVASNRPFDSFIWMNESNESTELLALTWHQNKPFDHHELSYEFNRSPNQWRTNILFIYSVNQSIIHPFDSIALLTVTCRVDRNVAKLFVCSELNKFDTFVIDVIHFTLTMTPTTCIIVIGVEFAAQLADWYNSSIDDRISMHLLPLNLHEKKVPSMISQYHCWSIATINHQTIHEIDSNRLRDVETEQAIEEKRRRLLNQRLIDWLIQDDKFEHWMKSVLLANSMKLWFDARLASIEQWIDSIAWVDWGGIPIQREAARNSVM